MTKKILWSVFLALAVAVLVLVALSNYSSSPPAPPNVTPAQIRAATQRIADSVKQRTAMQTRQTHGAGMARARSRNISVNFAQDDVNTMLATNADVQRQLRSADVDAARIAFEPPSDVRVDAWFDAHGEKRQVRVVGQLVATSTGGLTFRTVATRVGLLPLPAAVSAADIDERADMLIARAMPSLPLTVSSVAVRDGNLVLTGPEKRANRAARHADAKPSGTRQRVGHE